MSDGKIVFEVTIDDSGVVKDVKDITATIEAESKKWDQNTKDAFTKVGDNSESTAGIAKAAFEGAFIAITSAVLNATASILSAFGEWALASIDLASDLEEVQNVVNVTFGEEGAKKIETWAKKSGAQFGLSELQAKKYTSTIGAMLKSTGITGDEIVDMSETIAGLAADMASFYNLDFDTAFKKIRSGLTGQTQPLKELGINMSVSQMDEYLQSIGSDKSFHDMSEAEKTLTRYQYLLQATADAQGDFARTAGDSYANMGRQIETASEKAQASLGEQLLPIAKQWRRSWLDILNFVNGDSGVMVTGTKDQLQQRLGEQNKTIDTARSKLDELATAYGELFDLEPEDYNENLFSSFGEFFYMTLQGRQQFTGGKERERIDAILAEMAPFYQQIGDAESEVSNLQQQLALLETDTPDTTSAGAEVVSDLTAGMQSQEAGLRAEVNNINSILSGVGTIGSFVSNLFIPQHETGLSRVPYDGYLASLHEGEGILTAEENRVWQRFKSGRGHDAIDYDTMGGVMRDNIKPGGNVYLDGRIVGSVISDQQGRSYRQLQRSGWQA